MRSKDEFTISLVTYVIVGIRGQDPNPPITITTQPTNQNVLPGGFTYFAVDATPLEYLSYQWLFNGRPIPGQTDFLISFTNVTAKEAGNYSVEMTTGGKKVTSKKALLRVLEPVSISTQPKSQTVKAGRSAVFRVGVKGTGPITYQWYFGTNAIPQATKPFYTISKVTESDAGDYAVIVSNGASSAGSAEAVLTVGP